MVAKADALFFVLLLYAYPCSAMSVVHSTCANICRNYTRDDINYQYCLIACKEASTNKAVLDNAGYSRPSQLPYYFQNGEDVPMERGLESELSDFFDPVVESHRDRADYKDWTSDSNPSNQETSFVGIGQSTLFPGDGRSRMSEVQKRASSFVRIGRVPYNRNRGQDGPFVQLGRQIEEDEGSGDPALVQENRKPSFVLESGKPLMEEQERKRASSFVRIGRSYSDAHGVREQGFLHRSPYDAGRKRASSFVRIGRQRIDEDDRFGGTNLQMENKPSSANRVRKSLSGSKKKRASSFVRIGKSQIGEDDKRASSFVRIGKSLIDEDDKRASSFVRVGKDDDEKRASSFVRIGKSPSDDEAKRASSFVRIGKSQLDEEEKRASSFVRIGKSPTVSDDKRASSFVRIGKSPLNEVEKRASSFVRIGKSPIYEDKRASSFVRIGKSSLDEQNRSTPFSEIGKPSSFAQKGGAGSLIRRKKSPFGYESEIRGGSLTARAGRTSQQDSNEFQMNGHNRGQRYSAYWRLRKPSDPNDRNLLRIPRPVIQSLLNQNARVTPLMSSRQADQELLWIPVNDDEQRYLSKDDPVVDS